MSRASLILLVALALASPLSSSAAPQPKVARLLTAIAGDPSFKVRMQAVRLLAKQLTGLKSPPDDAVFVGLGGAATADESHLVRGMACYALGVIADGRGRPHLERARADREAFVRVQAEEALGRLPGLAPLPVAAPAAPPAVAPDAGAGEPPSGAAGAPVVAAVAPGAIPAASTSPTPTRAAGERHGISARSLVISVERTPGIEAPQEVLARLATTLDAGFRSAAGPGFAIAGGTSRGFRLRGSIAERRVDDAGDGKPTITLAVRITISTWPDNNLRHVISARASAQARSSRAPALTALEAKVLDAAATEAIRKVMGELSKS